MGKAYHKETIFDRGLAWHLMCCGITHIIQHDLIGL